jgi:hypothetical protein
MEALVALVATLYMVEHPRSFRLSGPLRSVITLAVSYLTGSDFRSTEVGDSASITWHDISRYPMLWARWSPSDVSETGCQKQLRHTCKLTVY